MKYSLKLHLTQDGIKSHEEEKKCIGFFRSRGFSHDTVRVPVKILRELIKSSLKYGKAKPAANEIAVHLMTDQNTYTIEVMNQVDETCSGRLENLDKIIQFIRGYQDPSEAYLLMKQEASNNYAYDVTDGLGLARIAYEESATFDFYISKDNDLIISAVSSLEAGSFT